MQKIVYDIDEGRPCLIHLLQSVCMYNQIHLSIVSKYLDSILLKSSGDICLEILMVIIMDMVGKL